MISKDSVFPVGEVQKTHGIHGELNVRFTTDLFDLDIPFFIFEMDRILVPFFVKSLRPKSGTTALMLLDELEKEEDSREMIGKTVYLPNEYLGRIADDEIEPEYFTGFEVFEKAAGKIGEVLEIDDSTENVLFVIQSGENELLIPMVEEYILEIDHEKRKILMDLPEGLLEL